MARAAPAREDVHREPGRVVRIEDKRADHFTQIPRQISDDLSLDAYEHRLYEVIRRYDWNGDGWVLTFADLLAAVRCRPPKLQLALAALRERGLVRWEGVAKRPKRYFAAALDPSGLNLRFNSIESTMQSTNAPIESTMQSAPSELNRRFNPTPQTDPRIESTIQSNCTVDSIELNPRFNPPPHPPYTESQTIIDDHRRERDGALSKAAPRNAATPRGNAADLLTSGTASEHSPATSRRQAAAPRSFHARASAPLTVPPTAPAPPPETAERPQHELEWELAMALYAANGGDESDPDLLIVNQHVKPARLALAERGLHRCADLVACTRWLGTKPAVEHVTMLMVRQDFGRWVSLGKPATYAPPVVPPPVRQDRAQSPPPGVSVPDTRRYTSGRYGVCPRCLSSPCEPDCPARARPGRGG